MGTSAPAGDTTTMSKGIAAPTENDAADVSAACTGRAAARAGQQFVEPRRIVAKIASLPEAATLGA